jgi:hypothetical protein
MHFAGKYSEAGAILDYVARADPVKERPCGLKLRLILLFESKINAVKPCLAR